MVSAKNQDQLYAMRHSLAHIMAAAIRKLYPEAKFGVGPVIEGGFYYDIDVGKNALSPEDLPAIEAEMHKIITANPKFERYELSLEGAMDWAKKNKQSYKLELLKDLKAHGTTAIKNIDSAELTEGSVEKISTVSFYRLDEFEDLCRGPHLESAGEAGAFKLHKIAGAYWRGDEKNPQLTRIYGTAFGTEKELDEYFARLEEAGKRDHRKLGRELDLFVFSDLVGKGLPLFTPRGTLLRDNLNQLVQHLRQERDYKPVWVPHLGLKQLYEKSGHWDKFGDELFLVKSQETSDQLVLKPMNCPHHTQIYASQPRSYRDLPLKYMETTTVYRDEKSGELHGLSRVRSATQDDTHVFCTESQIEKVVGELIELSQDFYRLMGLGLKTNLSFRDKSDKFLGDNQLWARSQAELEKVAKSKKLEYHVDEGEAAFYGPKIDMIAVDSLDREWQLATIQLDFVMPQRFGLEYTDNDGSTKPPVMVHFALLGSIERFLSVYIEHTGGNFPVWLAPEQVRLATVNDGQKITGYAEKLFQQMAMAGIRAHLDTSNESVGKKIRNAEVLKVPYTIVIGDKEVESGKLTPRIRQDLTAKEAAAAMPAADFIKSISKAATPGL